MNTNPPESPRKYVPGVAYALPVPDWLNGQDSHGLTIYYSTSGKSWGSTPAPSDQWWCLMPEIPKLNTQAEIDAEWVATLKLTDSFGYHGNDMKRLAFEAIAYARNPSALNDSPPPQPDPIKRKP